MNQKANPSSFGADFGAFVPGFDFLQKLAQGDHQALLANWIAPTLDPKVLDQRIQELKAVQFWLEQNATALKATLQALEVQKMTLAALQSMGVPTSAPTSAPTSPSGASSTPGAGQPAGAASAAAQPFVADAMQYWSALTQQFQTIAASAMKDVAARGAAGGPGAASASASAAAPAGSGSPKHDEPTGMSAGVSAKAPRKTAKKSPGKTPAAGSTPDSDD